MMCTFIPVHITFMYTGLFDAEPCHRAREQRERCRRWQGLAGQLLMEPLANYCSLPMLLPVLPFCTRVRGITILHPLFLHHPPLLPAGSPI